MINRIYKLTILILVMIVIFGCSIDNQREYLNVLAPESFIKKIKNKEDGVYLITSNKCSACKIAYDVIIEAAKDTDTTIYTLDVMNEEYEIANEDIQDIISILEPVLSVSPETNMKTIYTPHLFCIENGQLTKSQVGLGSNFTNDKNGLKNLYNLSIGIMNGE